MTPSPSESATIWEFDARHDLYHRGLETLYGHLVERQQGPVDAAHTLDAAAPVRGCVSRRPRAMSSNRASTPSLAVGEEAEVSEVDPRHGNRLVAQALYAFEQGSVAAVAHHDALARLRARGVAVYVGGVDHATERVGHDAGELLVHGESEAVAFDGAEHLRHLLRTVVYSGPGKKV